MPGTKAGAKKRLATMKKNARKKGLNVTALYTEWGHKGRKTSTGGFHYMDKNKLKEVSRRGVEARRRLAINNKGEKNV